MRHSFVKPIPELGLAIKLLDVATDAFLCGDRSLASKLIVQSDFPAIAAYTRKIVGPLSMEVHRQTKLPVAMVKTERDKTRMPPAKVQHEIFARDGWHCRFCGIGVIAKDSRNLLVRLFPEETHWVKREYERHSALYAAAASIDHVIPHCRGGDNDKANLVTACFCCQFGRGQFTLEEVEFIDPRERPPILGEWDGLTRVRALRGAA
jgi:5-methylcytosine-specific restriction endonuclease McrA